MKIRSIHLKDHERLGNVSVSMMVGGQVGEVGIIVGGCGSGKSLLLGGAAYGWAGVSLRRGTASGYSVDSGRLRVDLECEGEVGYVDIEGDRLSGSPIFARKKEPHRNLILYYDFRRLQCARSPEPRPLGVNVIEDIVTDVLSQSPVKDSVILIDDFDLGLDVADQKAFWAFLWKNSRTNNNQMIVSMRKSIGLSGLEFVLPHRENPLDLAMKLVKKEGV